MPIYEYMCRDEGCGLVQDKYFDLGEAEKEVDCKDCGEVATRSFTNTGFNIIGSSSKQGNKRKNQLTALNKAAGHRCRKEHEPGLKLAALDYGDGDVREVKKDPIMESIGESIGK